MDGRDSPDQIVPNKPFLSRLAVISSKKSLLKSVPSESDSIMRMDTPTQSDPMEQSTNNKNADKPASIIESISVSFLFLKVSLSKT